MNDVLNLTRFRSKIRIDVFKKILKENLNITSEKVLLIGDKGYKNNLIAPILANAYRLACIELGLDYEIIYQNFKGRGDRADEILIRKLSNLPKKSVMILNISNRIGSLDTLGLSFRKFAVKNEHRFVSSSSLGSINNKYLSKVIDTLDINYKDIHNKTENLRKIMSNASEIHVSNKAGTDLTYNVEGVEAIKATGIYRNPGEGGNLPGSEAYIAPNGTNVNGTIAIDGSIRLKNETIIVKSPVILEIKQGIIIKINNTPEAEKLRSTLLWAHNKAKNPLGVWRIGELGIGMNHNAKIIGSTIIDEKAYGTAHFAIGSNAWFGGDIKSIIHLDQVIRDPIIKFDGKIFQY